MRHAKRDKEEHMRPTAEAFAQALLTRHKQVCREFTALFRQCRMLCFLGGPECFPMPRAVAVTYRGDGVVIAADGGGGTGGEILSETHHEVFPLGGLELCYALCGRAAFDTEIKENE